MKKISFLVFILSITISSQNYWERVGVRLANVNQLIINSDGYIFAGTDRGVFRSTNNGDSWDEKYDDYTDRNISAIDINSNNDIFIAIYEFLPPIVTHRMYRSTDNGESWVELNNLYVSYLNINSNNNIFAGTTNGVLRSTDNGVNWSEVNNGLIPSFVSCIGINSIDYIFVSSDSKM